MTENLPTIEALVGANIAVMIFGFGVLWQKVKSIEKTLNNGMRKSVQEHGERLATLEARGDK